MVNKITIQCLICKRDFALFPCYIKLGVKCCSRKCANKLVSIKTKGHIGYWRGKKRSKKTKNKIKLSRIGMRAPNWKGGRIIDDKGYCRVWNKEKKDYVKEHRMIMEQYLHRKLEKLEIVHHKNGIRNDNRIENLELLTRATHHSGHKFTCPKCGCEFI